MTAHDPLAEVARLHDPAGPWLHLLWGAPADARQFGWLLAGEGLVARVLRGPCVRTAFGLFDEAAAALQFPGDLVAGWSEFRGLLGDLSWLPGPGPVASPGGPGPVAGSAEGPATRTARAAAGHVLVITRASLLLAAAPVADLTSFVAAVVGVAGARAGERGPALHVVLADDGVGLATVRARLAAVPAEVRDVVGWLPEEPAAVRGTGGRAVFRPGPTAPDAVDEAVAGALPADVRELRRGWEEYHGPATDPVRTYGLVLARPELAVAAAGLVAGVAARFEDGACVVLPVPADPAARDPRQAAFMATSIPLRPAPAAPAASPAPGPRPAPALPGGRPHNQDAPRQEPDAVPGGDLWTADLPVDKRIERSAGSAKEPSPESAQAAAEAVDQPSAGPPEVEQPVAGHPELDQPEAEQLRAEQPGGAPLRGEQAEAGQPEMGERRNERADAPASDTGRAEESPAGGGGPAAEAGPRDDPTMPFALVAADLEWEFAPGAAEHDPVDAALAELARDTGMFAAVFRTWTRNPAAGWVRVLLGYATGPADPARAALVAAAQEAGARRTCVEVVAEAEVGDVHRWLERRCVPLWRATPRPGPAPRAGTPRPPTPAASELAPDTEFRRAPAEPDEAAERLIAWAAQRPGVLGLVVAETGPEGAPQRVYGIVVDGDTEHEPVRAAARDALGELAGPLRIESFAPSRGLSPLHLRLYRGSTRLWTQRAERPTRAASTPADPGPKIDFTFDELVERLEVEDETLDGGFTLLGLAQTEPVVEPPPADRDAPDGGDRAMVAWASAHPSLLSAVRGAVTVQGEPARVYLLAVDPDADRPAVRRAAAAVLAAHGLLRAGVEVFCPLEPIPRFYLDLFGKGTQLWRSDRRLSRPGPAAPTEPPPDTGLPPDTEPATGSRPATTVPPTEPH